MDLSGRDLDGYRSGRLSQELRSRPAIHQESCSRLCPAVVVASQEGFSPSGCVLDKVCVPGARSRVGPPATRK
ncbi:hypothetical protein NDU88_006925 [Pleurodeles waltl]|uniref:Uncharacterized protein n=1 Tax=Pleurodeles waltl TaxID=8319 RepID=A0AAV7NA22_PLEWA|nr:hypothetical protein NDU88_006925 [Pleurodeles waltl]